MSAAAQKWLADRARVSGMLGCGVRLPDGKLVCRSIEETCPAAKLEKMLEQFAAARGSVFNAGLSPRWSTWTFDQAQIRFVERPDGWLLALVIRAHSEALPALDPLSQEFLALDLS